MLPRMLPSSRDYSPNANATLSSLHLRPIVQASGRAQQNLELDLELVMELVLVLELHVHQRPSLSQWDALLVQFNVLAKIPQPDLQYG